MAEATNTAPAGEGASLKLTAPQARCLAWYEGNRDTNAVIPAEPGWTMRQVNRLLELDMLHVGPMGWHVPTEKGLAALSQREASR